MKKKATKKEMIVRYTVGTTATCPFCHYVNDATRVDYCRHTYHKKTWQKSFKPHVWHFRRSA